MRSLVLLLALAACNDLRDFQGEWNGSRIGDAPALSFDARALGLREAEVAALAGGAPDRNARILGGLLDGEGGPISDAVVLNAAAALVVARVAESAEHGVALAREAIASGAARRKLERWSAASRQRARAGGSA